MKSSIGVPRVTDVTKGGFEDIGGQGKGMDEVMRHMREHFMNLWRRINPAEEPKSLELSTTFVPGSDHSQKWHMWSFGTFHLHGSMSVHRGYLRVGCHWNDHDGSVEWKAWYSPYSDSWEASWDSLPTYDHPLDALIGSGYLIHSNEYQEWLDRVSGGALLVDIEMFKVFDKPVPILQSTEDFLPWAAKSGILPWEPLHD